MPFSETSDVGSFRTSGGSYLALRPSFALISQLLLKSGTSSFMLNFPEEPRVRGEIMVLNLLGLRIGFV